MIEVNVYEHGPDDTHGPTLYEGNWPEAPAPDDIISWDDPKFAHSAEPKRWLVVSREYHWVTDCGMYVDLFVEPYPDMKE